MKTIFFNTLKTVKNLSLKKYTLLLLLAITTLLLPSELFCADYSPSTSGSFSASATWGGGGWPSVVTDNIIIDNGDASIDIELSADRTVNYLTLNSGSVSNITFSSSDPASGQTLTISNFDADSDAGLSIIIENGVTLNISSMATDFLYSSITVKNGGALIIESNFVMGGQGADLIAESGGSIDINGTLSNYGGGNTSFVVVDGALEVDDIDGDALDFLVDDGGVVTVTNDATFSNADLTINSGGTLNVNNDVRIDGGGGSEVVDGTITAGGDFFVLWGLTVDGDGSVSAATYSSGGTLMGVQPASNIAAGTSIENAFYAIASDDWDNNNTTWARSEGGTAVNDHPGAADKAIIPDGFTVSANSNNEEVGDLTIRSGGKLDVSKEFDINGDLDLENQAVLEMSKAVFANGNMNIDGTVVAKNTDINFSGGTITGGGSFNSDQGGAGSQLVITGNTTFNCSEFKTISKDNDVIEINAGITVTNTGRIISYGNIIGSGTWTNSTGGYLQIEGSILTSGTLNASAIGNTIYYTADANKDIKTPSGNDYYNLTVAGAVTFTMLNNLDIAGNLNISGATLNCDNNDITLGGNWTNSGTFTAGTGNVTFNGTSDQTFSRSSGDSLYNVNVNKSSGELILANNLNVSNQLTLTNGIITTSTNTLELGTDATNVGTLNQTGSSCWVNGYFKRWVSNAVHEGTDILLPIGTDTYYRPATPNYTGISADGSITATFVESNPGKQGFDDGTSAGGNDYLDDAGTPVINTFINGYWDLNSTGLAATEYNIVLDGEGFDAFLIDNTTRLLTRSGTGSDWTADGNHTPPASGDIVTRTNLTTIPAQYCFADITDCSSPGSLTITGDQDVCISDQNEIYSVVNTPGSSYEWSIKFNGGTIEPAGQGTNQITIDWGSVGQIDQIIVVEDNNCTIGEEYTLDVNIHSIQPVEIIGDNRVAAGQTGVVYNVQNYTNYDFTWSVTDGTITADNNDNITVSWNNTDGTGSVSVYAEETTLGCSQSATIDTNVQRYLTINSIADGDWGDESTWDCNCVPTQINSVKISHNVATSNTVWKINDVIVESAGDLEIEKYFVIYGDFIVDGNISGTQTIQLSGINTTMGGTGVIDNGSFLTISGSQNISSNSSLTKIGAMIISPGITVNNNGDFEISGSNIIGNNATSTWINGVNSTLKASGSILSTGTLYASADNNTIEYSGTSTQIIKQPVSNEYYNITFSGGSNKNQVSEITILGDYNNIAGVHNSSNYDINIAGNWSNTGTYNEGAGTVTFNGSENQSISTSERFYDLVINNNSDSVNIADDVTASNSLTLTAGNIILASGKKLDLNSDNFTYTDGKIVGQFERTISSAGTKIFPVGARDTYNPINFDLSGSPSGTIRSEFIEGDPGGTYVGLTDPSTGLEITGYLSTGYWETFFSFNPGTYDMDVTGDGFYSVGVDSIISATPILNRVNGATAWATNGNHADAVNNICYRTSTSLGANTYEFALGKTDCETFAAADSITGSSNVCKGALNELYSIPDRGNNYAWTVTGDDSHSGETTNELTVNWSNTASITSKVSVIESNTCYTAPVVQKSVWIHSLPTQNLAGPDSIFDNTENWSYTVDTRDNYTYSWTVTPLDGGTATIASGDGTGNALINFGDAGTYEVSVVGYYSSCAAQPATAVTMEVEAFTSYETQANGPWNVGGTWLGGAVPPVGSSAKILHDVTIPTPTEIKFLVIDAGSLTQSADFTVTGHYKNDGTHNGGGFDIILDGNGGSYTISGTGDITNTDTIHIDDNFEIMAGTVLSATATAVSINNGYTVRNYGDMTINADLVAQGTNGRWINDANSILNITGDLLLTQGELYVRSDGNTVNYSGADQTINVSENGYWHLSTSGSGTKTLAGNTDITGDLNIGASTTLDVSGSNYTILLDGNWTNAGTFNEQNGSVEFYGTADQTISSTGDEGFYDLVISQNSGIRATLSSNIIINNDLRLTRGIIETGANMVVVEDDATTNGGDADSFVYGLMQKNGDDDFIFPLGDSIIWARLGISFATPAYSEFQATYAQGVPTDTGSVTGMNNVSFQESWDLNKLSGNNVYLTLYCEDTLKSGIDSVPDIKIAHYTGGSWIEEAATITTIGSGITITTDAVLTSYSPFTFGSGEASVNPLPVELIFFEATSDESNVVLSWATATEKNNDYFTIERSFDGVNFEAVIKAEGSGNSSSRIDYSKTDMAPPAVGTLYYRLKQTDFNGEFSYSNIVSVNIAGGLVSNELSLNVYPNPYNSGELIIESSNIKEGENATISITDTRGNKILSVDAITPVNKKIILTSSLLGNLSDGLYIITIHSQKGIAKQLLIIE